MQAPKAIYHVDYHRCEIGHAEASYCRLLLTLAHPVFDRVEPKAPVLSDPKRGNLSLLREPTHRRDMKVQIFGEFLARHDLADLESSVHGAPPLAMMVKDWRFAAVGSITGGRAESRWGAGEVEFARPCCTAACTVEHGIFETLHSARTHVTKS